jgi:hypothetical protein
MFVERKPKFLSHSPVPLCTHTPWNSLLRLTFCPLMSLTLSVNQVPLLFWNSYIFQSHSRNRHLPPAIFYELVSTVYAGWKHCSFHKRRYIVCKWAVLFHTELANSWAWLNVTRWQLNRELLSCAFRGSIIIDYCEPKNVLKISKHEFNKHLGI